MVVPLPTMVTISQLIIDRESVGRFLTTSFFRFTGVTVVRTDVSLSDDSTTLVDGVLDPDRTRAVFVPLNTLRHMCS